MGVLMCSETSASKRLLQAVKAWVMVSAVTSCSGVQDSEGSVPPTGVGAGNTGPRLRDVVHESLLTQVQGIRPGNLHWRVGCWGWSSCRPAMRTEWSGHTGQRAILLIRMASSGDIQTWSGEVLCLQVGRGWMLRHSWNNSCNSIHPWLRHMLICVSAPGTQLKSPTMARAPCLPSTSCSVMGVNRLSESCLALGYVGPFGGQYTVAVVISKPQATPIVTRTLPEAYSPDGHCMGTSLRGKSPKVITPVHAPA